MIQRSGVCEWERDERMSDRSMESHLNNMRQKTSHTVISAFRLAERERFDLINLN